MLFVNFFAFLYFLFLRETDQLTVWPMVWLIQWGLMLMVDWWFYNKWINWALFSNLFSNVDLQEKECCINKGKKKLQENACMYLYNPSFNSVVFWLILILSNVFLWSPRNVTQVRRSNKLSEERFKKKLRQRKNLKQRKNLRKKKDRRSL